MAVSVLLVEGFADQRAMLRQALRLRGFEVVAEAEDGATAIAAAGRDHPDVVVLDLGLPDLAGHEVLTGIRQVAPAAQVVVYTGSVSPDRFPLVRQVDAYVRKDRGIRYLVDLLGDLARQRRREASVELGPDPGDVAVGRRFLTENCRRWGCDEIIEDAELVVSELVTNALLHAGTRCTLAAGLTERVLRLEITDRGGGTPDPRAADLHDERGRGLLLVSALCTAWGVDSLPEGGKSVWAELLLSGAPNGDADFTHRDTGT
jgi:CheY-like chemotaxis protein/anti-sigma regulatory factor (Ser/Thr protein kinase)